MKKRTLHNKVDLLPIYGNIIGIDKIIVEMPKESYQITYENPKAIVITSTGEMLIGGVLCRGITMKDMSDCVRFTINPAKVLFRNNFVSVNLSHIKIIIDNLKDEYGIDFEKGIVRRLDLQTTIDTELEPEAYYSIIGRYKDFNRNIVSSTLYYNSKSQKKYKTGMFYDKKKKASPDVPAEYINGNFLRLEWQYYNKYLKLQARKFGLNSFLVSHILDSKIYNSLLETWYSDYCTIYKEPLRVFDFKLVEKFSDLDNMLINKGVEQIGGLMVLETMIDSSRFFLKKRRDFYSKMKKRYRNKSKLDGFTIASPLIDELNRKVLNSFQRTIEVI